MAVARTAVIVGVGPGLGAAVARRFAREKYAVALVARRADELEPLSKAIAAAGGRALAVPADASDAGSLGAGLERVRRELGDPEVLVYNAGLFEMGGLSEITAESFERAWKVNCFGAFLAARELVPAMERAKRGTIVLTGATASLRGGARFASLTVGKFGLRALSQSLARELGPKGIHVAHVVVDGQIRTPRVRALFPDRADDTFLDPDRIAETYWQLHTQDATTWTLEIDLRPSGERF